MAEYKSRTVTVNMPQVELFGRLTDLNGILAAVPEDKRKEIKLDGDTVSASYAGFCLAVRISEKVPFSKIVISDVEAPFHFSVTFNLDAAAIITQTKLTVSVEAELNFMMKMMLGSKIQEFLDKAADAIESGTPFIK